MKQEIKSLIFMCIILCIVFLTMCVIKCFGETQRHYLLPPYKGQASGYSDWTLDEKFWNELTNCYVSEQGIIRKRPGFYCWKDSVDTTKEILGAWEYKRQIEGGFQTFFILNTNNKIYWTDKYHLGSNTDISGALTFSDDGIPVFDVFYNDLFMANGEENPIQYDQDANVIQIGRTTYSGKAVFDDTNEIQVPLTVDLTDVDYHFRIGMDLTIADSNNNGTYEIVDVDTNQIIVKDTDGTQAALTDDATDISVSLTGLGIPDELTTTRTETITVNYCYIEHVTMAGNDYLRIPYRNLYYEGFRDGMSLVISGETGDPNNNGTWTIFQVVSDRIYIEENWYTTGTWTCTPASCTINLQGTHSITVADAFNPSTITGHKGRLFAGGIKEFPTYLFWSRSKFAVTYYYDLWRDRVNEDDGTGYFDMQDKVIALVPDFLNELIIFCKDSIWRLTGDDPGFDILTPNQTFVFQPIPITKKIGCVGPNAWERIGNDIFFYSKEGLQQLSKVQQTGDFLSNLIILPIKDIHKTIANYSLAEASNITMEYNANLNFLLINCPTPDQTNDALCICYNLANNSFSEFTFPSASEPVFLFSAEGFSESRDPGDIVYKLANPYQTIWYGSEDGKLFSMHNDFPYDLDYEAPASGSLSSITMTAVSAKLNMGDPFLEKTFKKMMIMCSPQINYNVSDRGTFNIYYKINDDSWSPKETKYFKVHSDTAGNTVDYYEIFDERINKKGKTIQYKIESTGTLGRFGLDFIGIMTEWNPIDWRI